MSAKVVVVVTTHTAHTGVVGVVVTHYASQPSLAQCGNGSHFSQMYRNHHTPHMLHTAPEESSSPGTQWWTLALRAHGDVSDMIRKNGSGNRCRAWTRVSVVLEGLQDRRTCVANVLMLDVLTVKTWLELAVAEV